MKALVVDGVVVRVTIDEKLALFPPHLHPEFVDVPTGVVVLPGDIYDGNEFSRPGPIVTVIAQ